MGTRLSHICIVYVVKQVASFWGAQKLIGIMHNKCTLDLYRPAGTKLLLVDYIKTATKTVLAEFYSKILQNKIRQN